MHVNNAVPLGKTYFFFPARNLVHRLSRIRFSSGKLVVVFEILEILADLRFCAIFQLTIYTTKTLFPYDNRWIRVIRRYSSNNLKRRVKRTNRRGKLIAWRRIWTKVENELSARRSRNKRFNGNICTSIFGKAEWQRTTIDIEKNLRKLASILRTAEHDEQSYAPETVIGDEAARYSVRGGFRPLTAIVSSRYFISWKSHSREKENRTVDSSGGLFFFFFNFLEPIVREHATPLFPFIRPILRKLKVLRPGRRWQPKRELGRERSSGDKSNKLRHSVRNPLAYGSEDFSTLSFFPFLSCGIFSVSLYVFRIPISFYRESLFSCFLLVRFLGQIIAISLNVRYEQPIRPKWLKF